MADIEQDKAWMARRSAVAQASEIVQAQEPYPCGCKRGECTGHMHDGVHWVAAGSLYVPAPAGFSLAFFDDFSIAHD